MAKTASKTRKKSSPDLFKDSPQLRIPITGERVRRQGSDTEYEITYVSPDCRYVHIGIPRTNFEHRNVQVSALIFLEESHVTAKPARRPIDTDEIRERLDTVRHGAMDPYLVRAGHPEEVPQVEARLSGSCRRRRRLFARSSKRPGTQSWSRSKSCSGIRNDGS